LFISTSDAISSIINDQRHTLDSVNRVISFVNSKKDLKLGEPGSKHHSAFFYEICPSYTVASFLKAKHLSFPDKSNSYDGRIYLNDNHVHKVECVRAGGILGSRKNYFHNEHHRMEHSKTHKRAPAFGRINANKVSGAKGIKEQFSSAQMVNLSARKRALYCNLTRAFCEKQKTKKYEGMWLIISVDDWYPPLKEVPFKFLFSILKFWEIAKNHSTFERLFVVGESLNPIFWDSNNPTQIMA
jgi:hypothetical protein